MTKLLEHAIAKILGLPEPQQDVAARFLMTFADPESNGLARDAQAAVIESATRADAIANEAEMDDVWLRFGS